jgi:hypothetical protein
MSWVLTPLCNGLGGFLAFWLPTLFQVFCFHDLAHLPLVRTSHSRSILPFWRCKKMKGTPDVTTIDTQWNPSTKPLWQRSWQPPNFSNRALFSSSLQRKWADFRMFTELLLLHGVLISKNSSTYGPEELL